MFESIRQIAITLYMRLLCASLILSSTQPATWLDAFMLLLVARYAGPDTSDRPETEPFFRIELEKEAFNAN